MIVGHNYGVLEVNLNQGYIDIGVKGRQSHQFLINKRLPLHNLSSRRLSPGHASFCENHFFKRRVWLFEKVLYHVPKALIEDKNLFLLLGISGLILGLSGILASPLIPVELWRVRNEWK